jgi:hypothetical protein
MQSKLWFTIVDIVPLLSTIIPFLIHYLLDGDEDDDDNKKEEK